MERCSALVVRWVRPLRYIQFEDRQVGGIESVSVGNIASLILLKVNEADKEEVNALMAAGLVLFLLTLIINGIANILVSRLGKTGR